jgi:hypothetical protein
MDEKKVCYARKFYDIVSEAEGERADLNKREDFTSIGEEE